MTLYELESLDLPAVSGSGLRLMAAALDNNATKSLLLGRLMRDGGIDKLRARSFHEAPTLYPLARVQNSPVTAADPISLISTSAGAGPNGQPDIPYTTLTDYAEAYASGSATPLEIAERILEAIAKNDATPLPMRAFIANDGDDVMAQARKSARRIQAGKPLSVLDGVPVAIKDEFDQTPYPTTVGTAFLGHSPAAEDSTVVARLRTAGALLIGKANMYEIGINPEGFNLHFGTARNPYDLQHDPGGSSSGPAVAVAAGFCPVAIGADAGGSIRIPAAHCGLVGLKATFGRVSEFGAAPLAWSVAHVGPIGATVSDVALAYAAIAGPDPKDPMSLHQPAVSVDRWDNPDLTGLCLGVYEPWFNHATSSIVDACQVMLEKLERAGARLVNISLPQLDEMRVAHVITTLSEMAASLENLGANWADFSAPVRINLALGRAFSARDYVRAQRVRTRALAIFEDAFSEVDAIMTPATAMTAPEIPANGPDSGWSNLNDVTEVMRYVFPANLTGLPAVSFPVGYDELGLPIGMQAMGKHWEEHVLLQIAYTAEQVTDRRLPATFVDLLG